MIRFFALLARKPSVDPAFFHDYWRHPHGTMGNQIPGMRTMVQGHQVHTPLLGDDQSTYEAIAMIEFESASEASGLLTEHQYYDRILPDEPSFMDKSKFVAFATDEEVLVPRARPQDGASYADALWIHMDRSTSIQLLQFIRPAGNPDWAQADDADLGRSIGALRQVRNTPSSQFYEHEAPFLGVRQLWWPTYTAFAQGVEADPDAFRTLLDRGGDSLTLVTQSERMVR